MVVIKPPSYQVPRHGRSSGKINLGRALCYFFIVVYISYLADQAFLARNKNGIRGAGEDLGVHVAEEPKQVSSVSVVETANTDTAREPLPPPPPAPEVQVVEEPKQVSEFETAPEEVPEPVPAVASQGPFSKLCERDIGINLEDHSKWPTPYTPTYLDEMPESKEVVLFADPRPFGNTLLVGLFHLLELGYDGQCPVYVTKDALWLWDMMTHWFYGENYVRDDEFWITMREIWDIEILDNAAAADKLGKETVHKIDSQGAFHMHVGKVTATMMRNLHDTVFRKLFQHSRTEGDGNVCSNIVSFGLNKGDAKYTFVDVAVKNPSWDQKLIESTGRDLTDAIEMKPEYIKSILEPLQMLEHSVYLEKSLEGADPNREEVKRLIDDPALKTEELNGANDLFLAVLANVYIGNPASHWSLMVAKMRYALGIKNSFVLTEKTGDQWASYVDDTNYLELYDKKMGHWLG